jgi:hypothetical protein
LHSPERRSTRRRIATGTAAITAIPAILLASALPASAAPDDKVTWCHATGSETHPYVEITVSAAAAYNGHLGKGRGDHQDGDDIIPRFEFRGEKYGPQGDWAILAAGCDASAVGDGGTDGGGSETGGGDGGDGGQTDGGNGVGGDVAGGAAGGGVGGGAGGGGPIPGAADAGQQAVSGWQPAVGGTLTALGLLGGLVTALRRKTVAS